MNEGSTGAGGQGGHLGRRNCRCKGSAGRRRQLLTNRRAAEEGVACRPVCRGHAPEGEQNGLGALGPRREARVPTASRGPHSAFGGRGARSAVSTPDTWPGRGGGSRDRWAGWEALNVAPSPRDPPPPPVTVEVAKTLLITPHPTLCFYSTSLSLSSASVILLLVPSRVLLISVIARLLPGTLGNLPGCL